MITETHVVKNPFFFSSRSHQLKDLRRLKWFHRLSLNVPSLAGGIILYLTSAFAQESESKSSSSGQSESESALVARMTEHVSRVDADADRLQIPDFQSGKKWFNSPPLSFQRELKGKITVLDFWTYCCINCIHVLPELAELEAKYAGFPVAFIGVHSAKFENEKNSENIREAVMRYEITHPVINDDEMFIWRKIGVRSWPSLVVVGPKGNLLLMVSGEGNKETVDACITAALEFYPKDIFRHEPIPMQLEKNEREGGNSLNYPGKLAVDLDNGRLFISDSNHHRILISDFQGNVLDAIGSGRIGLRDGGFTEARFNRLQGIVYHKGMLYVADSENHALRQVDLETKKVITLAGDGKQGRDYQGGKIGSNQQLSTPWDVLYHNQKVYIAMAGTHQIWVYDIDSKTCTNFSGNGSEQNLNHDDPLKAAWAQPSGLTFDGSEMFIADSESSAIRSVSLLSGKTRTLVGGEDASPRNLFDFGDLDGVGDQAMLQHPLGVLYLEKMMKVLVADTYNHRIKLMDPASRKIEKWVGSGEAGYLDGKGVEVRFSEPSGFAIGPEGKTVFVADTNNHKIRVIQTETLDVTTLNLRNVPEPLASVSPRSERLAHLPGTPIIRQEKVVMKKGEEGVILLNLGFPDEYHLTPEAPSRWQVLRRDYPLLIIDESIIAGDLTGKPTRIPFRVSDENDASRTENLRIEALAYFCKDDGVCRIGAVVFEIPIEISPAVEKIENEIASNATAIEEQVPREVKEIALTFQFQDQSDPIASPLRFK
ncbi:MAG TPA: redoxin domain-containing protein [Verrucomicrobiales bacterium]|nr:redoxin domain-containing protein [Verrucomicrobiales bacterium]